MAKVSPIKDSYQKEIINLIKKAAYSKAESEVFCDWLEMAAISISNQCDFTHRETRENRYLEIINSYEKKQQQLFPEMFALLVAGLDEKVHTTGPEDILGSIYHTMEFHNIFKAQYFTPQHIADMMAKISFGEDDPTIKENGYISVCEPTCGSGVMITSFCKVMKDAGYNYCNQLVVTAIDIDIKCVHMAYLQLSLYGIPAVVIHGNSLTLESWSRWYTPVYMLNGWIWRDSCTMTTARCTENEMIKCALEPTYAALRQVEKLIADTAPTIEAEQPEITIFNADSVPFEQEQMQLGDDFHNNETPGIVASKPKKRKLLQSENTMQLSLLDV